jgi:hypothetical protein
MNISMPTVDIRCGEGRVERRDVTQERQRVSSSTVSLRVLREVLWAKFMGWTLDGKRKVSAIHESGEGR